MKKLVDPAVLEEYRDRADAFLSEKGKHRMKCAVALSAIWIFLLTFLAVYIIKKVHRHHIR